MMSEIRQRTIQNNDSIRMWGYSRESPNFRFKEKLTKSIECTYGLCNSFDTFLSPRDNQPYILYSNKGGASNSTNIFIYSIKKKESKKLTPCIHMKELRLLKYFINIPKTREYIISADCDGVLCIWPFKSSSKFFILQSKITAVNQLDIYSCLILFKEDINFTIEYDYLIFACENIAEDDTTSAKIYSLNKGTFLKNMANTFNEKIRYLLIWHNKKNNEHYLICLAMDKIIFINLLKNQKEREITTKEKNTYNCGFIYSENFNEENEKNYLCCTSSTGHILVFELEEGIKISDIFLRPNIHRIYDILPWNENYFIVADTLDNGITILGFEKGGKIFLVSNINGLDEDDIECIRKINHPEYGECIVTCSHSYQMKIFGYISAKF